MEKNPQFLKQKYDLHKSPEVESAARRTQGITGNKISENPGERIQNYLNRLTDIFKREDPTHREQGVTAFKRFLHDTFVIKTEAVPESVFFLEQRIARELGHGNVEITEEFKQRKTAEIINNQKQSLDKWIDYIGSPDARYPDWAKYWTIRSVLEMGKFVKEQSKDGKEIGRFQKRTKDTAAAFPPCNPRALAETITAVSRLAEEKMKAKDKRQNIPNQSKKLLAKDFQILVSTEDFSRIYTQFLVELPEYSTEGLQEIRGKWVKYERGTDPKPLVDSLDGYPLEWCTAGYNTAKTQLEGGDFYVYYSRDKEGEDKIPRVAVRMEGDSIAEVRGIAPDQNLDPYIAPVIEEKMKEFGQEGEMYKKKSGDMAHLTALEEKIHNKQPLTKDDLIFLYEMNSPIEGFGYGRDPRINELRSQRDRKFDVSIVLDCPQQEIALAGEEISKNTKIYIGPLFPGIFTDFPQLENIYTSFLSVWKGKERRIRFEKGTIGGKDRQQLQTDLKKMGVEITDDIKKIMQKTTTTPDYPYEVFTTRAEPESIDLVRFRVDDLGFSLGGTTNKIYQKAGELGLELCPPEVGPRYRLAYTSQPVDEHLFVAIKPISGSGGFPNLFQLTHNEDGVWLEYYCVKPGQEWDPKHEFVFRLPKKSTPETVHSPATVGQH